MTRDGRTDTTSYRDATAHLKTSNSKPSYLNAYDDDGRDNDGRSCGDDVLKPKRNDFMS